MVAITKIVTILAAAATSVRACRTTCKTTSETADTCVFSCKKRCEIPNDHQSRDWMLSDFIADGFECKAIADDEGRPGIECKKDQWFGECRDYRWLCGNMYRCDPYHTEGWDTDSDMDLIEPGADSDPFWGGYGKA